MTQTSDVLTITTPSGKKVVIRNYTTRGDDKQAESLLYDGVTATPNDDGTLTLHVPMAQNEAAKAKYVELLVQSIDGSSDDIPSQLDNLRSDDYKAVADAVGRITSDPKASPKT